MRASMQMMTLCCCFFTVPVYAGRNLSSSVQPHRATTQQPCQTHSLHFPMTYQFLALSANLLTISQQFYAFNKIRFYSNFLDNHFDFLQTSKQLFILCVNYQYFPK